MLNALLFAVEHPFDGKRIMGVPEIRACDPVKSRVNQGI
jgi:hypothetical protein